MLNDPNCGIRVQVILNTCLIVMWHLQHYSSHANKYGGRLRHLDEQPLWVHKPCAEGDGPVAATISSGLGRRDSKVNRGPVRWGRPSADRLWRLRSSTISRPTSHDSRGVENDVRKTATEGERELFPPPDRDRAVDFDQRVTNGSSQSKRQSKSECTSTTKSGANAL